MEKERSPQIHRENVFLNVSNHPVQYRNMLATEPKKIYFEVFTLFFALHDGNLKHLV